MEDGFILFMIFILCIGITNAYSYLRMQQYRIWLKMKDELIECMIAALPNIFLEEQLKNCDLRVMVRVEYDSTYLKIKYQCENQNFISRLYSYLDSLTKLGYKVSADYINGPKRANSSETTVPILRNNTVKRE